MYNELYEVTREEYKSFVERIYPEAGYLKETYLDGQISIVEFYSNKTNQLWCSRVSKEDEAEKYFIFNFPEAEEWGPPIPKRKIILETKEEVQALFDALAELRKRQNG